MTVKSTYSLFLSFSLPLKKFQRGGLFSLVSLFLSLSSVSRRFDSIAVFLQRFSGIHLSSSFFRFVRSFNLCLIAEYNVPDFQGMIFIIDLIIALMILSERKAEPKKISLFFSPGLVIMSLWVCSIFSWVLNTLKFYFLLLDFRVFQRKI